MMMRREAQEKRRLVLGSEGEGPAAVGARSDREWGLSADDAIAGMLVRREARADRHGRAANGDLAVLSDEAEIRAFGRVTEMFLGFAEGAVNAVVDSFDREHFFPPYAVLLGHHCPTHTLARGNSECNPQLSQFVWALHLPHLYLIFILIFILIYLPSLSEDEEDKDGYGEESYETIFIGQIGWTHSVNPHPQLAQEEQASLRPVRLSE